MFGRRGPSHIPIVAGAGARGRNGLIYRPFMSLQCSLAVFEFICGGRPTGWSWAQMGFECSMPARPLPIDAGITPHLFVCSHGSTGAAACRGALVCGQRAGIHGFLTCHPPTLQVDEEVGAARAFAHCSFHGRRGGVWVLVSGSAVSTALPSAPLLGTFVPQFGAPARILPRTPHIPIAAGAEPGRGTAL